MTEDYNAELEEERELPEDQEGEFLDPTMEPFNPADIDIVVEPKSLDSLVARMNHGEIDMNTDFQRHADLWDNQKMSRLIESILIRLPLPAFYFDASNENKWLIVDGLQRLSTIKKFMLDKKLRLRGLEFLVDLNGKNYDELHRNYQRRLKECQITAYMIRSGTPEDVKYSVFRRINTGGLTLNNQEIRNALANPDDRLFLKELASNQIMRELMGDQSKRMKDQELVLRFWAFYKFDYLAKDNKKEMASFLDKAMKDIRNADEWDKVEIKETFETAISRCYESLGLTAFHKDTTKNTRNLALYEVWMVSLAKLSNSDYNSLLHFKDFLRQGAQNLLADPEFIKTISFSTQKVDHVQTRYSMVNKLIQESFF